MDTPSKLERIYRALFIAEKEAASNFEFRLNETVKNGIETRPPFSDLVEFTRRMSTDAREKAYRSVLCIMCSED